MDISPASHPRKTRLLLVLCSLLTTLLSSYSGAKSSVLFVPTEHPPIDEVYIYGYFLTQDNKTLVTRSTTGSPITNAGTIENPVDVLTYWDIPSGKKMRTDTYASCSFEGLRLSSQYIILFFTDHLILLDRDYKEVKTIEYSLKHKQYGISIKESKIAVSPDGNFIFVEAFLWNNIAEKWLYLPEHGGAPAPKHILNKKRLASNNAWERCARVSDYNTPEHVTKLCVPGSFLGLGDNSIMQMMFVGEQYLIANYSHEDKSCLFDIESKQRLKCWSQTFVAVNDQDMSGIAIDKKGRWTLYQLSPIKKITQGRISTQFDINTIKNNQHTIATMVDKQTGDITMVDMKNGDIVGQQTIDMLVDYNWMFLGDFLSVPTDVGLKAFSLKFGNSH